MAEKPEEKPATETETEPKPTEPKPTETVEFWKQKAREQEARAKANADAATKLKQLEDNNKSDSEKLVEKVADAERRATQAEAKAMRFEIAAAKQLTPAQAKYLSGSTKEELEAKADEILEDFGSKPSAKDDRPNVSRRPNPTLNGGGDPTTEAEETDPSKLAAAIRSGM